MGKYYITPPLNHTPYITQTDAEGRTAVHYAAFFGKYNTLKSLISSASAWAPRLVRGRGGGTDGVCVSSCTEPCLTMQGCLRTHPAALGMCQRRHQVSASIAQPCKVRWNQVGIIPYWDQVGTTAWEPGCTSTVVNHNGSWNQLVKVEH